MSLWIVGSQFGVYHTFEDCPGVTDTFGVEVDIMDVLGRDECRICKQRRSPAPVPEDGTGGEVVLDD